MPKPGFLWITDPWETLEHATDTTLRLAQEALASGFNCHWCDVRSIRWERNRVLVDAARIEKIGADRAAGSITLGRSHAASPLEFRSLQYRTDPPVDLAFQHPLQLLHLALESIGRRANQKPARRTAVPRGQVPELVNPASALLLSNEKLEAGLLPGLCPPSVVSSLWVRLEAFGTAEGRCVLKPLHQAQSKGVELLEWSTPTARSRAASVVEEATSGFTRPVLLQRYLPGISRGETRLWFIDGKLLACARKLPLEGDFRVNIDRGSGLAAHKASPAETRAALAIGRRLREIGARLAAVDLIDGYVTDFNLTSPGLICQMEKILDRNLARPIIQALTQRWVR